MSDTSFSDGSSFPSQLTRAPPQRVPDPAIGMSPLVGRDYRRESSIGITTGTGKAPASKPPSSSSDDWGRRRLTNITAVPHILYGVIRNLAGDNLLAVLAVSKEWRHEARHLVVRHIVYSPSSIDRPLQIFSPNGRHCAIYAVGDPVSRLRMIEQHTLVIDCDDMSSDSDNSHMAFSVIVPNIRIIRRYRQFNVGASASTIVDFQASTLAVDPFCQDMRCERYVVPNLAYARQDWSSRKISKLMNAGYQSVAAISFDKIKGLTNRTPKEVVLLFLENEAAGLDEAFLLIRSGCHSIMSASRLPPKITFVGLRADDRRGDSLEEELEEYTSQGWPALQMDPSWFRFLSHTEYREKVGEEQYALETNKSATVLEGARSALPNIDSLLA